MSKDHSCMPLSFHLSWLFILGSRTNRQQERHYKVASSVWAASLEMLELSKGKLFFSNSSSEFGCRYWVLHFCKCPIEVKSKQGEEKLCSMNAELSSINYMLSNKIAHWNDTPKSFQSAVRTFYFERMGIF